MPCLTAGYGGDMGFEIERRAVFAEDVIAEGCFDYGGEHAQARPGDHIALTFIIDAGKKRMEGTGLESLDLLLKSLLAVPDWPQAMVPSKERRTSIVDGLTVAVAAAVCCVGASRPFGLCRSAADADWGTLLSVTNTNSQPTVIITQLKVVAYNESRQLSK
ncbi:hypothetical protein CIRG_07020 [Coccidioides immitis RMSCC 2394]|uniref:Uncharacterized protein n=1 Tax=Coccidioides immitis RMSCC 2394 TaxID=404692 RepID=A0A0J6YI94_COCIT|nr:hypothetical protein CIRG_07020 [Coccidioides immitis RMSCC 2394]